MQTLDKSKSLTYKRVGAFVGASAIIVGAFILREVNPATNGFFPQCPFHALTGLNCPGCGATRGFHALLNGDVFSALHFNILLVVIVPAVVYAVLSLISFAVRGEFLPFPKFTRTSIWVLASVTMIFVVVRNLPFYPFNLLAI